MIDSYLRSPYQTLLVNPVVSLLSRSGVTPHTLTALALAAGVLICPAIALGHNYLALLLLIITGYLDTLDGTLARLHDATSPTGAVFDIVSDRVVELSVISGLFLVEPTTRGIVSMAMLGSVLICVTSFLVVGIFTENNSAKSFHYSPGIMERTEAFAFFAAMILLPSMYTGLGALFSLLVGLTAVIRVMQFAKNNPDYSAQ